MRPKETFQFNLSSTAPHSHSRGNWLSLQVKKFHQNKTDKFLISNETMWKIKRSYLMGTCCCCVYCFGLFKKFSKVAPLHKFLQAQLQRYFVPFHWTATFFTSTTLVDHLSSKMRPGTFSSSQQSQNNFFYDEEIVRVVFPKYKTKKVTYM